jgi:hypothetical protein
MRWRQGWRKQNKVSERLGGAVTSRRDQVAPKRKKFCLLWGHLPEDLKRKSSQVTRKSGTSLKYLRRVKCI